MTKRLADLTPEEQARRRAASQRYREKNRERRRIQDREYCRRRRAIDPEFRKRRNEASNRARIKSRYGITPEEAQSTLVQQKHKCAICDRKLTRTYHIDHCHKRKKFRAILCAGCNTFLGRVEKYPKRLWRTLQYIEEHK